MARARAAAGAEGGASSNGAKSREPSTYAVLRIEGDGLFREIGTVKARTAGDAVREALGETPSDETSGEYVAVPERSIRNRFDVKVKTEPVVKVEQKGEKVAA